MRSPFILTRQEKQVLCALADPKVDPPNPDSLAGSDPVALVHAALCHGVGPVVFRKFSSMGLSKDQKSAAARDELDTAHRLETGVALLLEAHAADIQSEFDRAGLEFRIIKGFVFAKKLYPHLADRPYVDVDVLVAPGDLVGAAEAMSRLGYTNFRRRYFDKSRSNREHKWFHDEVPDALIEIHTDIVHDSRLRRRLSFGLEELRVVDGDGLHPKAGYLALAVIHAAAGHKLHVLKLLVDVLQAIRSMEKQDLDQLLRASETVRLLPELAMCTHLVEHLFPTVVDANIWPEISKITDATRVPYFLDGDVVLDAIDHRNIRSRLRRHAFRWYQIIIA